MTIVLVHLHPPFQYEVASDAKQNEEKTQHGEVDEETRFLNIELFQDVCSILEDALVHVFSCTLEWFTVEPIDGEQDPLETKPADRTHCQMTRRLTLTHYTLCKVMFDRS